MDVKAMRDALKEKHEHEAKMVHAARAAGVQVIPSPHLDGGRPVLLVSPELYQKLTVNFINQEPKA